MADSIWHWFFTGGEHLGPPGTAPGAWAEKASSVPRDWAEPVRAEPGRAGAEPGRAGPGEPGRAELCRAEPGRAEPGRAELCRPPVFPPSVPPRVPSKWRWPGAGRGGLVNYIGEVILKITYFPSLARKGGATGREHVGGRGAHGCVWGRVW